MVPSNIYHTGYENWDTTMTCHIFGYPPPRMVWTRATQRMSKGRHVTAGKDLIIRKTRYEDAGPYMCRGTNKLGTVYTMIVLFVEPVGK